MKLKVEQFHFYNLVTVCFDYASEVLRTRYREPVQYILGRFNRNYSAILATLQITSYALGVYIALLFTCQLHESLIKLYLKQFSIFQLKF